MPDIIKLESISDMHKFINYEKPLHPMITKIDTGKIKGYVKEGAMSFELGFYAITLKNGSDCIFKYGRNRCDFEEGSLLCTAPGQIINIDFNTAGIPIEGWMLCFHPDLIRGTNLANRMKDYTYFNYRANEALHLSDKEKNIITSTVNVIEDEISLNLDVYSNNIILSNLEVLLNYCERFYGRQFITRKPLNIDIVIKFEELIKYLFQEEILEVKGIPSISDIADELGYSNNYLSDLLRKETGSSAQDHIHNYIIEKAKDLLIGSDMSVSNIAYLLGYNYPEYFMKFFKRKAGVTPSEYRKCK